MNVTFTYSYNHSIVPLAAACLVQSASTTD